MDSKVKTPISPGELTPGGITWDRTPKDMSSDTPSVQTITAGRTFTSETLDASKYAQYPLPPFTKFEVCVEVKGLSLFGRETMVIRVDTPAKGDPNEKARDLLTCVRSTILDWEMRKRREVGNED